MAASIATQVSAVVHSRLGHGDGARLPRELRDDGYFLGYVWGFSEVLQKGAGLSRSMDRWRWTNTVFDSLFPGEGHAIMEGCLADFAKREKAIIEGQADGVDEAAAYALTADGPVTTGPPAGNAGAAPAGQGKAASGGGSAPLAKLSKHVEKKYVDGVGDSTAAMSTPLRRRPGGAGPGSNCKLIKAPDLSGVGRVSVVEVLVEPGRAVQTGAPLLTVETDRGLMHIPSPVAGRVREIPVQRGDPITTGTDVLVLQVDGEGPVPTPTRQEPATDAGPSRGRHEKYQGDVLSEIRGQIRGSGISEGDPAFDLILESLRTHGSSLMADLGERKMDPGQASVFVVSSMIVEWSNRGELDKIKSASPRLYHGLYLLWKRCGTLTLKDRARFDGAFVTAKVNPFKGYRGMVKD